MNPFTRKLATIAAVAAVTVSATTLFTPRIQAAAPQDGQPPGQPMMENGGAPGMMDHAMPGHDQMPDMMQQRQQMMMRMHAQQAHGGTPTMPGQDAFGAVQEIVQTLEADPKTDWSKVDLEALRQHLIDMNDVTLKADVTTKPIDGGLEIAITGSGRTLAAIQRMVPTHAKEIEGLNGWSANTVLLGNGVLLKVTSRDPKQVQHIRGLGFIGILVSGSHHQMHHLAMAIGNFQQGH
jgi:hypothetical protein